MQAISWTAYLIVCPCVFLAGFVDSIAGGGGLISLPAYLLAGLPAHLAIGTNKLSSSGGTIISAIRYAKNRCVDWKAALPCIAASLLGAQIGSRLSLLMDEKILQGLLLLVLPAIAIYNLKHKNMDLAGSVPLERKKQLLLLSLCSLFLGVYDGFYGPGTGTFLLLAYTRLGHMPLLIAGGNTKLVNLASNLSSLVVFLVNDQVMILLGAAACVFSIAGHYVGSGVAIKNGGKPIRIVVLCVVMLFFCKILWDLLSGGIG